MAFDAFLTIQGITDNLPNGELALSSFSWGVSNAGTISSNGGAESGKSSFQDFSFTAQAGAQSPLLFKAAATGQTERQAILKIMDRAQPIVVTFQTVLISSYKLDENPSHDRDHDRDDRDLPAVQLGPPMENVSFNFFQFNFSVGGNSITGTTGGPSGPPVGVG
jgi:type VI protein secretion system component Hcp